MEHLIQTLTLATILLIIGLTCVLMGMAGLARKAARDRPARPEQTPHRRGVNQTTATPTDTAQLIDT